MTKEERKVYHKEWWLKNKAKQNAIRKAQRKAMTAGDKEKRNNYFSTYRTVPQNRVRILCNAALTRAKKLGMAYSPDLFSYLVRKGLMYCGCCGRYLDYSNNGHKDASPSLDRFDNNKGYTKANVKVICMRCNSVKRDSTVAEFETVLRYMKGEK